MIELIVIAAFVLIFWNPIVMNTIGPFIIWKKQKIQTNVEFAAVDESSFIEERNKQFKKYDSELHNLKFVSIGSSVLLDSHNTSHFRLYWNAEIKLTAMVASMNNNVEDFTFLEFIQLYSDDTMLTVNNSKQLPAYPEFDFKKSIRFPKVQSPHALLKYHALIKEKLNNDAIAVDYEVANGFKGIEEHLKRESDELLKKGFVKENIDENGKRSLTLLGAFSMTIRSIAPWKIILGYINEREAKKLLSTV